MTLSALREVYNPLAIKKESKPLLNDWKDSVPVVLLSEYLKQHSNTGISLCHDNGAPCLSFYPGLSNADKENGRWQIAENAERLFFDAAADLTELISTRKLILHQSSNRSIKYYKAMMIAGPSGASAITGNSHLDVYEV